MMKRIVLVVDTIGWAFWHIAKQIEKAYSSRYKIDIIDRLTEPVSCDVALVFWWKSAVTGHTLLQNCRLAIGVYDHWSVPRLPHYFNDAVQIADAFFCGNEGIATDIQLRAPGKQIVVTEDGVDTKLFSLQPFPQTFTVGWTGNRVYESIGLGDLKGVKLIEEACRRAKVPLLIQDKQVKQLAQTQMPAAFYRKISCYCCASICEGTPNPVLEALACGRPVVTTRVGLTPKLIEPGRNGYIVERNVESLTEAIIRLRDAPSNGAARQSIEAWDWTKKVRAFQPLLELEGGR